MKKELTERGNQNSLFEAAGNRQQAAGSRITLP